MAEEKSWHCLRVIGVVLSHHMVAARSLGLAEVDASLQSAAYELEFVPTDYSEMTDFQILKAEGVYMVEKMRTIKLMVAQFNEITKNWAET